MPGKRDWSKVILGCGDCPKGEAIYLFPEGRNSPLFKRASLLTNDANWRYLPRCEACMPKAYARLRGYIGSTSNHPSVKKVKSLESDT